MPEPGKPRTSSSGDWSERLAHLRRLAARIAPDRDTAEEVCAEAAVRLVRWRDRIREFLPWAATIVRRLTWSIVRRRRAQLPLAATVLENLPARDETGVEIRVLVAQSLARVAERHAAILRLHREGFTHREIAARLGLPLDQVGPRLTRAQRAVRRFRERPSSSSDLPSTRPPRQRSIEGQRGLRRSRPRRPRIVRSPFVEPPLAKERV